jgi:hypothetical protein
MIRTSLKKSDPAADLYTDLELLLWNRLHDSKKHKAYYLFSVLYSEAYYLITMYPLLETRFVTIH